MSVEEKKTRVLSPYNPKTGKIAIRSTPFKTKFKAKAGRSNSKEERELIAKLLAAGGFYYESEFPSVSQLRNAVEKRYGEGDFLWSAFYNAETYYPESSSNLFVEDPNLFDVVESLDWPLMPMTVLSFEKVLSKYSSHIIDFVISYQLHVRSEFTESVIRTCSYTPNKRFLGLEYSDTICNMDPLYQDVGLDIGQYTYVIGIVNLNFSIGYKKYIHANEIGSKHLCIVKKFKSMDPDVKIVIAGEIVVTKEGRTFNLMSGSVSVKTIVDTLDTVINSTWPTDRFQLVNRDMPIQGADNAVNSWWAPFTSYLLNDAKFSNKNLLEHITTLSSESESRLCSMGEKMYEFGSNNLCDHWAANGEAGPLEFTQDFCHPSHNIRQIIGKRIIEKFSDEKDVINKTEDSVTFESGLTLTSKVLNIGGYAVIIKGSLNGEEIVAKVSIDHSQKIALQRELTLLYNFREVLNLVLPVSGLSRIGFSTFAYIIFPFYNRGNLADYMSEINIYTRPLKERIALAKIIAESIIPALIGMHAVGYLHLDISFSNILINYTNGKLEVALTDVGIAKKEKDFLSKYSNADEIKNAGSGTLFESINIALGIPPTGDSDFESLGYVLYGLVYGDLPWTDKTTKEAIPLKEHFDAKFLNKYFDILHNKGDYSEMIDSLIVSD